MQVDPNNIDGLFVSDRDGQPFVVRYGVDGGLGANDPVVFEAAGAMGSGRSALPTATVEEVDSARYDQLLKGGLVHRSPASGAGQL